MTIKEKTFGEPFHRHEAPSEHMRPAAAARYTGLSESTLAKLRMRHNRADAPRHIKISGCVIYRRSDLDEWMNKHLVGGADNE